MSTKVCSLSFYKLNLYLISLLTSLFFFYQTLLTSYRGLFPLLVTVNTKVDMRFNVKNAYWLSDRIRERIMQMVCYFHLFSRILSNFLI